MLRNERLAAIVGVSVGVVDRLRADPYSRFTPARIRRGEKVRPIAIPDDDLKLVQRGILRHVLQKLPQSEFSHCRPKRSILTNARVHIGADWVLTVDIKDAFPNTSFQHIRRALRREFRLGKVGESLVQPITSLCTYRKSLPQGAPTSGALLDVVLADFDQKFGAVCSARGFRYSRYVDDITISGSEDPSSVETVLSGMLSEIGYRLNAAKRRLYDPRRRATVTGLILDSRPTVNERYTRDVKKFVAAAARGEVVLSVDELRRLRGKVDWIAGVHPRVGAGLRVALDPLVRTKGRRPNRP